VFPTMIYVWFRRFKENLSKLLDSLLFLATVCSKISLYQREQVLYNRWHVMYWSWFFECKTLFRLWNLNFDERHGLFWVRRGIRDKSKRCLNFTLCLFLRKYRVPTCSNIMNEKQLMFVSNALWNITGPVILLLDKLVIESEESKLIRKT